MMSRAAQTLLAGRVFETPVLKAGTVSKMHRLLFGPSVTLIGLKSLHRFIFDSLISVKGSWYLGIFLTSKEE